ncbi:MAG: nucleoside triphosphate pyrophosphatase, partial [Ilumatobacteraceae bacterium]
MLDASPAIVLASRSPRRIELLTQLLAPLRLTFTTDPADIDETPHIGETPLVYVRRCAVEKASVIAKRRLAHDQSRDVVVIGADTTVEVDGQILGQPLDLEEAAEMLRQLSGRTHQVHTAVSIQRGDRQVDGVDTALVTMVPISPDVLTWYLQTEESLGKAGAYGAQGEGNRLVDRIDGNLGTVIGLPIGLV